MRGRADSCQGHKGHDVPSSMKKQWRNTRQGMICYRKCISGLHEDKQLQKLSAWKRELGPLVTELRSRRNPFALGRWADFFFNFSTFMFHQSCFWAWGIITNPHSQISRILNLQLLYKQGCWKDWDTSSYMFPWRKQRGPQPEPGEKFMTQCPAPMT